MIRLDQKTLNGVAIRTFEVRWRTIRGLHLTLDDALKDAEEVGFPPEMIRAIPVAVDINGNFEEIY